MYSGGEKLVSKILSDGLWVVVGSTRHGLGSDVAKYGIPARASSAYPRPVSGTGRFGADERRTFTVVQDSTELGLLASLFFSSRSIQKSSHEGKGSRGERSGTAFDWRPAKVENEGRRWGKRRLPRESHGWQFTLSLCVVKLRGGVSILLSSIFSAI